MSPTTRLRTQVAVIGAGPAGLVLAHLLDRAGIECIVVEAKTRAYIEQRVRAGVLEHPTVELLRSLGLADRLDRQALTHRGIELAFAEERHRIDFEDLTGKSITVYAQQELVKDLVAARLSAGGDLRFEVQDVALHDLESNRPSVSFVENGTPVVVECDLVAGCDGFHGICRPCVPPGVLQVAEREYPFAWLGILAKARPTTDELIYSSHERGFSLYSMRSPEVTRLYLQVDPGEDLAAWPDDRIWSELSERLPTQQGFKLEEGPILERGITAMRSFVATPMSWGRLHLAGDAAHIVPPTGAKGLNLAVADVVLLADAIERFAGGDNGGLDAYADAALERVWRVQHFSWWMTSMLHRFAEHDEFQRSLQLSELRYVTSSRAASTALAENYVGLPHPRLLGSRRTP